MKMLIKIFSKILIITLKLFVCLFFTLAFIGCAVVISFTKEYDWQINFYKIFSLIMIPGLWVVFFLKVNKIIKLIYIFLFIFHFFITGALPSVKQEFEIDNCYDDGNYWDHNQGKCIMQD